MTEGATSTCDVTATTNAGWCWVSTSTDPSNAWDKHEQIVAYYTDSLAPSTVLGYDIVNTVLDSGDKGTRLSFTGTLDPNYLSGNRNGIDYFNNPDEPGTTDFNTSISILRQGEVDSVSVLNTLVETNLTEIKSGDYILIDPRDTGGGAHGLIVVGWGPIEDCEVSLGTRRTVGNFSVTHASTNTVPYVSDFANLLQSPTPRPFYCSMYNDQIVPITGYFNRHNWHVYTLDDSLSIDRDDLYVDESWSWTASSGQ